MRAHGTRKHFFFGKHVQNNFPKFLVFIIMVSIFEGKAARGPGMTETAAL